MPRQMLLQLLSKTSMAAQVNSHAAGILAQSDWMSIRAADGGTAVPSAWATYRTAVRTTANAKETEIAALADVAAVKLYEAHPVTYTRKTYDDAFRKHGRHLMSPQTTTVNKVNWTELGGHADSWPTAPDHTADPSFVSVANT